MEDRHLLAVQPFPLPLDAVEPGALLVYSGQVNASIDSAGETETYTIELDAGQTLTLRAESSVGVRTSVEVIDPAASQLILATAASPGDDVLVQTVGVSLAGTYEIHLRGAGGTIGDINLQLILNAAQEEELFLVTRNDGPTSAQDLDSSFLAVGSGQRGAVMGQADGPVSGTLLFSETFPTTTANPTNWTTFTATIDAVGANEPSEPNSARFNLNDVAESIVIDLSARSQATLNYFVEEAGGGSAAEAGDDLLVEYFNSSGVWVQLDENLGSGPSQTTFVQKSVSLPSDALHAGFRFRFVASTSVTADDWFVDDIQLIGDPLPPVDPGGDWYRFTLADGHSTTLTLADVTDAGLLLEFYASDGVTLLARGAPAIRGLAAVADFVNSSSDGADDTFFARVVGSVAPYTLVATRNTSIEVEPNNNSAVALDISLTGKALGSIGGGDDALDPAGPPVGLFAVLTDGTGFVWDMQPDGSINNGSIDAYDGGLILNSFPSLGSSATEQDGREIVMGPAAIGSLQVTRKIFVPADQGFARFLEIVTNTSAVAADYTITLTTNLGSDSGTQLVATSSGDSLFNTSDDWIVTDDGSGIGDPTMLHVTAGPGGIRPTVALTTAPGDDDITYSYALSLAPGETGIVMHFASQNTNQATALAKGPELANLELGALRGMTAEELDQVVNFAIGASGGGSDLYRFRATAGDSITITTTTPGDGAGQPDNLLDPDLEILDPRGNPVPHDNVVGNETVVFTAATDGEYTVRVFAHESAGNYAINVTGHTGGLPPFDVSEIQPPDGSSFLTPPGTVTLTLNDSVLLPSVDLADLMVDGNPVALAVNVVQPNVLQFDLPVLPEGVHTLELAAGALTDLQGQPLAAFQSQFSVDQSGPRVIASSILQNDVIAPGQHTYTVTFDEPLNESGLDVSDISLVGNQSGVIVPSALEYESATSTLTLEFASLAEDTFTLRLFSGDGRFEDVLGNDLDGEIPPTTTVPSGDGVPGGDFVLNFSADHVVSPLSTPLLPVAPHGSLIYAGTVEGNIQSPGDVDRFSVQLGGGQTATVVVEADFRAEVSLWREAAGGEMLLASASANSAGDAVLLNTVSIDADLEYYVQVVALDGGQGSFQVELLLNAAMELEEAGGPQNDTASTAQPIDSAFIPLGGSAERGAIRGANAVAGTGGVLFEETFPTSTVNLANWAQYTATIDGAGLNEPSEPNAGRFNLNDVAESLAIDLSPYASASISYFVEEAGGGSAAEAGDDLLLEYFNVSGQWITLDTNLGNGPSMTQFVERNLPLPADALHANFRFRFLASTSVTADDWFVDDIRVTADPLVIGGAGDWYRFSLTDGQGATLAVDGPDARIELFDATGTALLATGTPGENATQVIRHFVDTTSDGNATDYLVVVSGTDSPYRLVVTRGSDFDTGGNDSFETAQDITGLEGALGHVVSTEESAESTGAGPGVAAATNSANDVYLTDEIVNPVFPQGWLGEIFVSAAGSEVTQDHSSNPLTIVLDFNGPAQPNTTDGLGNVVTTFDVTSFGFAADDFDTVTQSVLDQVRRHYDQIATSDVFPQSPIPPGMALAVEFVIGDIGTPPSNGSTDYYYVQIGTGVSGQCIGALGCASVNSIRNSDGVPGAAVGSVIGSIFSDAIQAMGGLSPSNALSSGNLEFTTNAVAGTISHEAAHGLSLLHLNWAGAVTPNGYPPIMGTGAIDLPNQQRIGEREFAYSGFNAQNGGAQQFHMNQLVSAVGLHAADDNPPLSPDEDWYQFAAQVGDVLEIAVVTPGGNGGEFQNPAAPFVRAELLAPSGVVVKEAATSFSHVATSAGNYRLRLFTEQLAGEYFVTVNGATGQNSPPTVVSTLPGDGALLNSFPQTITVQFSEALTPGSLEAADLLIDGVLAATAVEPLDGLSYRFTIDPTSASGDGVYDITIPAGAVSDLQGQPNAAYEASFALDSVAPTAVALEFNGAPLPVTRLVDGGGLTISAWFSEDLSPSLDVNDVELLEIDTNVIVPAGSVTYDPSAGRLTAEFGALVEGSYRLRLRSGDGAIEDLAGNDLDGEPLGGNIDGTPSGDGAPGGDFVVQFTVDGPPLTPALPFERLLPLGSQMARSSDNTGLINTAGDVDDYSMFLQAGQRVSVVATPDDPNVSLSVALLGIGGPVSSASPGAPAVLSALTAPTTANYTLRVIGGGPTSYTFSVVTGAVLEASIGESTISNEVPLDLSQSSSSADLYAALGSINPAPSMSTVFFEDFNLGPGSFTIANHTGSSNGLWHWSTGRSADGLPYHSPAGSMYFGQNETPLAGGNFQTGAAVGGTIVSPSIVIPVGAIAASASFHQLLETQGSSALDIARLDVLTSQAPVTLMSTADGTLPSGTGGEWDQVQVDLSQFAGQSIRLAFVFDSITADQNDFEGWFIDDVRIQVATSTVPDVDEFTVDLSAAVGEPIDFVVAGQNVGSQKTASIEILSVDGTTVLATGSASPLGHDVNNYDCGVLGFIPPVPGEYTLRIVSQAADDYGLVVTRSLLFDSEPNNSQTSDAIRSLNGVGGAIGLLSDELHAASLLDEPNDTIAHSVVSGVGPTSGNWIERGHIGDHPDLANLTADVDLVQLQLAAGTRTLFRIVATQQGSTVDPLLSLFNSAGVLVAQNDDFFGLDSFIDYTATESGTYYVGVSSFPNYSYDPHVEGSGNGGSSGFYDLIINVGAQQPDAGATPFYAPKPAAHQHDESRLVFKKDEPLVAKVGQELVSLLMNYDRGQLEDGGHTHAIFPAGGAYDLLQTDGQYVLIDAIASEEPLALWEELIELGLEQGSMFQRVISGMLPIASIRDMAELATLRFARPVWQPITMVGATTSQGDAAMRTDSARVNYGIDGTGVTIGVLSDSYDTGPGSAAADIASGDLPGPGNTLGHTTPVNVLADLGSGSDEGRAMLQLIHDVAPGANLAFHTAFNGEADFANGILELASVAGADVIVDDVIYFAEPMFQDGIIAQAIDTVVAGGVPYFSAAGNNARQSWEGGYQASGVFDPSFGTQLHDFDPGPGVDPFQNITVPLGSSVTFSFQWDSPFFSVSGGAGTTNDLDIFIFNETGSSIVAFGTANNLGNDAVEVFTFTNGTRGATNFNIAIGLAEGAAPSLMKWVGFGPIGVNEYQTHSATAYGHANAAGAAAVGAAFYHDTPAFGLDPPAIELFSSAGGISILFDAAGNPVNELRAKPNFVAPDGTNTTFFGQDADGDGFPNFFGTSAAAPHAAALAALMSELNPSATPAEIYAAIAASAIDMDDPFTPGIDTGFDSGTGAGLVEADAALALIAADPALTGPRVVSIDPPSGLVEDLSITSIAIDFSEPPTIASAQDAANYLLLEAGPNGVFESAAGDDRRISVTPNVNGSTVNLQFPDATPLGLGRYRLVVRAAIVDDQGNALGSTTGPGGGRDRVHDFEVVFDPPGGGDLYTITVPYGQAITLATSTPWDDASATPLNDLDPQLILFDPLGQLVAVDQDTADGKNAWLRHVAAIGGTYTIQVASETGVGEYLLDVDLTTPARPTGDYNGDGFVNAADFVVWRNSENTQLPAGTGADGNGDGLVDSADYNVWRAHFGDSIFNTDTSIDSTSTSLPPAVQLALRSDGTDGSEDPGDIGATTSQGIARHTAEDAAAAAIFLYISPDSEESPPRGDVVATGAPFPADSALLDLLLALRSEPEELNDVDRTPMMAAVEHGDSINADAQAQLEAVWFDWET